MEEKGRVKKENEYKVKVEPEDFQLESVISKGSFGVVHLARLQGTVMNVLVSILQLSNERDTLFHFLQNDVILTF